MSKVIGFVLWWSDRDENGVIEDAQGNEYYFDRSTVCSSYKGNIKRNDIVEFKKDRVSSLLCGKSVSLYTKATGELDGSN